MAATKAYAGFTWGGSGSTTSSGTSDVKSTSSDYYDEVNISIVIVATPSAGPSVQIYESPDGGTTWYALPSKLYTPTAAAGTYNATIPLQPGTTSVKLVYAAGTVGSGGSHTISAQLAQITGI